MVVFFNVQVIFGEQQQPKGGNHGRGEGGSVRNHGCVVTEGVGHEKIEAPMQRKAQNENEIIK